MIKSFNNHLFNICSYYIICITIKKKKKVRFICKTRTNSIHNTMSQNLIIITNVISLYIYINDNIITLFIITE